MRYFFPLLIASAFAGEPILSVPLEKELVLPNYFPQTLVPDLFPPLEKKLQDTVSCSSLDILFLYDVTGSMESTLASARQTGMRLLRGIKAQCKDVRFAFATVADFPVYGGVTDSPYTLVSAFSSSPDLSYKAVEHLLVSGGGDSPEAYPYALRKASNEDWREDAQRFVVLVADSTARDLRQLQESVTHSNFTLLALISEHTQLSYWQQVTPFTFPLPPSEMYDHIVLDALEKGCRSKSSSQEVASLR
ncbi:VWA domain-containing protein [Candidatus Woesearchaeota archaeon]|nr:VWA domain-containing protein [Candidatus Woesearchaeota archaeon]